MSIKVENLRLQNGSLLRYVKMGHAVGKKAFIKEGFIQAPNPNYMTKGNIVVHYNNIMKVWIME